MTTPNHTSTRRIAILVKRFPRLSETFILNEFLELRRLGLLVELYAIMDPHESRSQPEALALLPEVTYLQSGSRRALLPAALRTIRRHPAGSLRAALWTLTRHSRAATRNLLHALVLVDLLARRGPAHLHAHFLHSPAAIAYIAKKISGQPYSLTGHAKDIYTTLEENVVLRCNAAEFVTTCTAANRAYLIERVGLDAAKVHLCRHGVDVDRLAATQRRPVPGRIVSVGRLVPKKGFADLIDACAILHQRGVAFHLRIIGSGDLRGELGRRAEAAGIGDRVHLVGACSQDEVIAELAAASVFALAPVVMPDGDRDGIPNVLLEAMAAGVPVVTTDVSGIPEVVANAVTGLLVPEHRPERLADALAALLGDQARAAEIGRAGRAHVLTISNWDRAIVPLHDLLRARPASGSTEPEPVKAS